MRLCRVLQSGEVSAAFYLDSSIVPIRVAAEAFAQHEGTSIEVPTTDSLILLAATEAPWRASLLELYMWCMEKSGNEIASIDRYSPQSQLLLPIPSPPKLLLLAGNYAEHVEEDGSRAEERENTFPYVFSKPPSTTLLNPCDRFVLPPGSPNHMDWEVELAAIIGTRVKDISEKDALKAVAGYTVLNDISDRRFRPNPGRKARDWDKFFDWMHGKWHDGSAPCGPCMATPETVPDPQALELQLTLNGELRQRGTTADQVFPLAAVISFLSTFVTLEPGDIISTGTPAGVGSTTGTYLKPGDQLVATIPGIGSLSTTVAESVA